MALSTLLCSFLSSNPGKNNFFVFCQNSCKNRLLKFITLEVFSCLLAFVVENTKDSGSVGDFKLSTPQNPLIHPVNDVDVIPVYVIISSSIFNSP